MIVPEGLSPTSTIAEGKAWLSERLDVGASCPCCLQTVRRYRRTLNHVGVRTMILLWRRARLDFAHLPSLVVGQPFANQGGELVRAQHWGLLVEEARQRPDGGRAGFWAVTPDGEAFLEGRLAIAKYVLLYDNRLFGFDGPQVRVRDCLGQRFDLDELLGRKPAA